MSESDDELDERGNSNGTTSLARVLRTGAGKKEQEADDQEGEEGVEAGQDDEARRIAAEDKELRIIPRDRAVKIWTTELGNPAATFQWDPANHREFKCGVCWDKPSIRCKAMTLRQHCKRNKHTEALKDLVGGGGAGKKEEEEERPLVKQAAVFAGSNKKKKKKVAPPPEPSDDDDEQDEEEEVVVEIKNKAKKKKTPPPAPKKRERAPPPPKKKKKKTTTPSPKKKNKKQKVVDEENDDDAMIDIAPVSRDLEDDWKRYVAKNLGPKQREAMFSRRLRKIMDEFENGKK